MIGRADSPATNSSLEEEIRWVGKPWRRIERVIHRHWWKGEVTEEDRSYSLHIGLRRLGLFLSLEWGRATVLDYSDEPNQ